MTKLVQWMEGFWQGLGERDRQMLVWGSPVILLLALFLLLEPVGSRYLAAKEREQELRSDLLWLADLPARVEAVNSSCSLAIEPVPPEEMEAVVVSQARRLGFTAVLETLSGTSTHRLVANSVPGNALMSLTQELACRGVRLERIEVTRLAPASDRVNASLELRLP